MFTFILFFCNVMRPLGFCMSCDCLAVLCRGLRNCDKNPVQSRPKVIPIWSFYSKVCLLMISVTFKWNCIVSNCGYLKS